MEFKKVLETVFIREMDTTAMILTDEIVVKLWDNSYLNKNECFTYIYDNFKGWIQTSEAFKEADRCGKDTALESDPLEPYETLYYELNKYAKKRYLDEYNCD